MYNLALLFIDQQQPLLSLVLSLPASLERSIPLFVFGFGVVSSTLDLISLAIAKNV